MPVQRVEIGGAAILDGQVAAQEVVELVADAAAEDRGGFEAALVVPAMGVREVEQGAIPAA